MKKILTTFFAAFVFLWSTSASSQSSFNQFLTPADSLHKTRVVTVGASWAALYTGTMIGLSQAWYADYPKSSFHFFNDGKEWLQMDKMGHAYTAYFESVWTTSALQWSGIDVKKSAWLGAATGFLFQSSIELLDGFSSEWGASPGDLAGNFVGSALCLSQYLAWNEQRIQMKFSAHLQSFPDNLTQRTGELYGHSFSEEILKNYNAQTYWLSINPSSFFKNPESRFPKWLNIAAGYGVDGLWGARSNTWDQDGETISMTEIARVRQFYLSPDIDFTRIKTHSPFMKTFFAVANVIKIPAPALEINSKGDFKFYPLYF